MRSNTNAKHFDIKVKCECGNDSFKIQQKNKASFSKEDLIMTQTMCHSGFGWEMNWFDYTCSKCGNSKLKFEVSEIKETKKCKKEKKLKSK